MLLSNETLGKVCKLLSVIAEGERVIEVNRHLLSFHIDIGSLFRLIDVDQRGFIDLSGIDSYLKHNQYHKSNEDINALRLLILFYDQHKKNEITYDDFSNMLLSTNPTGKRVMRTNLFSQSNQLNDKESNALLMKCIEKEIQFAKEVIKALEDLKRQYDYNSDQVYVAISDCNSHIVTKESLEGFFNRVNAFYENEDIKAILHRLDLNRDSAVNYNDYYSFISFRLCLECNSNTEHNVSMHTTKSYDRFNVTKYISPSLVLRQGPLMSCNCNCDQFYNGESKDTNKYNESIEAKFIEYYKLLIEKEKIIEKAKVDLVIRPDFTIADAFRLFNTTTNINTNCNSSDTYRNYLFISDIELYFRKINCILTPYDLKLLNKRIDLRHKGYINYADFFDFLAPFQTDYRKILEQRSNEVELKKDIPPIQYFSAGTIYLLNRLVSIILEAEKLINGLRLKLKDNKKYLIDLFRRISQKDNDKFTIEEFISFLKTNSTYTVLANEMEISLVYIRLDRNRTGHIELFELDDEFTYVF